MVKNKDMRHYLNIVESISEHQGDIPTDSPTGQISEFQQKIFGDYKPKPEELNFMQKFNDIVGKKGYIHSGKPMLDDGRIYYKNPNGNFFYSIFKRGMES